MKKRVAAILLILMLALDILPIGASANAPVYSQTIKAATYHTVSFVADDETVSRLFVTSGSAIGTLPSAPKKEGYTFQRWVDGKGNTVIGSTPISADMTLTAVYLDDYPAFRAESFDTGLATITIDAPRGAFPADVMVRRRIISGDSLRGKLDGLVEGAVNGITAVDISFVDPYTRQQLQPLAPVSIQVKAYGIDADTYTAVHIADSGTPDVVASSDSESFTFDADSFSIYAIIGTDREPEEQYARYTYRFFVEGEEIQSFTQIVRNGDTLIKPDDPVSVQGSRFLGWYDENDQRFYGFGTVSIDEETKIDREVKLYAKFADLKRAVFFHRAEDDAVIHTITGYAGDNVSTDLTYRLPGNSKAVIGWTTEKDNPEKKVGDAVQIPADDDLHLWPVIAEADWIHWASDQNYRVVYDAGYGVGAPIDDELYAEFSDVRVARAPSAPGSMVFTGWKINGKWTNYQPGDFYTLDPADAKDGVVTFVAAYKFARVLEQTQITFDANNGTGGIETVSRLVNNGNYTLNSISDLGFSAREGYTFIGWNTQSDGNGNSFYAGETIAVSNSNPLPNILYAIWERYTYTVTWLDWDGTELKVDEEVPYGDMPFYDDAEPTREEDEYYTYIFNGWTPDIVEVTEDAVYTAEYIPEEKPIVIPPEPAENFLLTVNYLFEDGSPAAASFRSSYEIGTAYDVQSPAVSGYTPDKTRVAGTISQDTTVDVVYSANTYNLMVLYRFLDGSEAAPTHHETLITGESYEVASPEIIGFVPDLASVAGTMTGRNLQVTVFYTAIPQPTAQPTVKPVETPTALPVATPTVTSAAPIETASATPEAPTETASDTPEEAPTATPAVTPAVTPAPAPVTWNGEGIVIQNEAQHIPLGLGDITVNAGIYIE